MQQASIRLRAALMGTIYQKGLTLSSCSRQSRTSGEMVNIMSVDGERVGVFCWYVHDLWPIPIQIGLALAILYSNLGLASLSALAATIVIMLVNLPLTRVQGKFQGEMMEAKDVRMKVMSEVLHNMRILKFQGWEMKFLEKIISLRKNEESWIKKFVYVNSGLTFLLWGTPTFVAVITFGTCMLMGVPLESGKVLSALATFRILSEPIYVLPDAISVMIQTKVSIDRIASFLSLEDLPDDVTQRLPKGSSGVAVQVQNGTFSWDLKSEVPTLKEMNFEAVHGMKVAVCGTVGSGKSSLLSSILGEMPKLTGEVTLCGTTAYVSQSPWIQSGKIQDNILFGTKMDRDRYERILEACSLKKDLEILPHGDQTVIGERGINLSGGQKQRIQIARALYQDADIFLFDDPFSAVDAHTGSHLFKECLLGLLGTKTVIYVTHQVEFLPAADLILVMKEGNIVQAGKYEEILESGTEFMQLVSAHKDALSNISLGNQDDTSSHNVNMNKTKETSELSDENSAGPKGQLVTEEEREKGKVGFQVYWKYLTTAYKGTLALVVLLAYILFQVLQIVSNYWMAWAAPVSKDAVPPASTDQSDVDTSVPYTIGAFAFSSIQLLGVVVVMSQIAWEVFIVFVPVIVLCIRYQKYYIETARELARLFGVCKAPIIQHFAESLTGSSTIRSFNKELNFKGRNEKLMDDFSRPKFYNATAMEWLCFRLDMLTSFAFAFSLALLVVMPAGVINPGVAGLAVRYAPQLPFVLRGLTCTFPGGMKTGIVGRTGSGKSTLIQTLFRIVDPTVGQILIDSIDICTIGLHDLRSRLSIIPQDPTMFQGTVRSNLDPLDEYTDAEIWEALDCCQLGDEVRNKELKLETPENGENWSVGQRQLVCLARVILKKSKILVLDEATASVDTSTDSLIQKTLRQQFSDSTVITIAHRITSVLDSDMVLLLDNGVAVEHEKPTRLLEDKSSMFSKLVLEYTTR
ncbi:hypothetical protein LUZ61_017192 [Rhynchospora tenuis]|uniref:ABC transporter C family member 3 n=1 Tax=Rhynchospora tenuis TaxID=198213 RepID=A0AAD5Z6X1_9POAL|nr:hypothetical protein LUZ61_017192 [Rhynchospora tenuis]